MVERANLRRVCKLQAVEVKVPPSPTPQWAGAGWGGRSQRIQVSPSPQQLMPHTLKSQPERTQMLGKERSEDASRAGWRRWHPAGGDSTDQPRHSWSQPAPRPGLPCSCSVPGGVRGPALGHFIVKFKDLILPSKLA